MSRYDRYDRRHRTDRFSLYPQSKSKGERMADAAKKQQALEKKGAKLSPVVLDGFALATTCWGKAWCKNIESYHDYANRLPRGRSYLRSRSVIDLQVEPGLVRAQVMGSSLYRIEVGIKPVARARWTAISAACAGKIGSLIELLQGRISSEVMAVMTQPGDGLFPTPTEITFKCSCPDSASMCKHIAAALYGIGSRLDRQPELLFLLRGADPADLIAAAADTPGSMVAATADETLAADELADVFNVDFEVDSAPLPVTTLTPEPRGRPKKTVAVEAVPAAKKVATKKPRGRPKKVVAAETKPVATTPTPKPRGCPKKASPAEPAPKRPRGRPRKQIPTEI